MSENETKSIAALKEALFDHTLEIQARSADDNSQEQVTVNQLCGLVQIVNGLSKKSKSQVKYYLEGLCTIDKKAQHKVTEDPSFVDVKSKLDAYLQ